jgi:competence protein ComEA
MRDETFLDRLASLSRREIGGLAAVLVITLAAGALWYVRSLPRPIDIAARPDGSAEARPAAAPPFSPSPATLFVDVAGAVRRPGVYEFHDGQRVIDAINAAGGERRGAALEGLNLAAPLVDGTQILVPNAATDQTSPPAASGAAADAVPGDPSAKININTADAIELEELPGIGEVLSQAIVDYRTKNGPFTSVDELEDVSGIGPSTLEDVRDLVTV